MSKRAYFEVVTIGDVSVYEVGVDPNNSLAAEIGSVAIRKDVPGLYVNTDGATSWDLVGGGSSLLYWSPNNPTDISAGRYQSWPDLMTAVDLLAVDVVPTIILSPTIAPLGFEIPSGNWSTKGVNIRGTTGGTVIDVLDGAIIDSLGEVQGTRLRLQPGATQSFLTIQTPGDFETFQTRFLQGSSMENLSGSGGVLMDIVPGVGSAFVRMSFNGFIAESGSSPSIRIQNGGSFLFIDLQNSAFGDNVFSGAGQVSYRADASSVFGSQAGMPQAGVNLADNTFNTQFTSELSPFAYPSNGASGGFTTGGGVLNWLIRGGYPKVYRSSLLPLTDPAPESLETFTSRQKLFVTGVYYEIVGPVPPDPKPGIFIDVPGLMPDLNIQPENYPAHNVIIPVPTLNPVVLRQIAAGVQLRPQAASFGGSTSAFMIVHIEYSFRP